MPRDAALLATLQATLAPHAATLTRAPGATIRPLPPTDSIASRRLGDVLHRLRDDAAPLELEEELGRGGMGVVRLATQRALGRKVAVKQLRPGAGDEPSALRLLQEAWITGAVEHPNVVPIHDVDFGGADGPLVVFKRIEGSPWSQLLADPGEVRRRFGIEDALEWQLRTLMQVCTAVHYAHSRGILHRDLKPENVMIGEYGEVYVVDWGIAVSMRDDGGGRLPLARDVCGLAGTPAYMAPEMMAGDGAQLGPHTDVYLLGGLLHALLTGRPPHRGATPLELALDALRADRELPPDTSTELAAICHRALAPDPAARFESADALRHALQAFLDHRSSDGLAARTEARLVDLLARVATPRGGFEEQLEIYRLFGECRFGFRQALESWPGNARAAAGLERATRALVERELAVGNHEAASALLAELERPPADLVERAAEARLAAEAERRRVEALQRLATDLDARVGRRMRVTFAAVMALLWMALPVWRLATGTEPESYASMIRSPLLFALVALALAVLGRRTLLSNAFNRRVVATVVLALFAQTLLNVGSALGGLEMIRAQILGHFMGLCCTGVLAVTLVPRLWPAALTYGAGFLLAMARPELHGAASVACNSIMALNAWIIWGRRA